MLPAPSLPRLAAVLCVQGYRCASCLLHRKVFFSGISLRLLLLGWLVLRGVGSVGL